MIDPSYVSCCDAKRLSIVVPCSITGHVYECYSAFASIALSLVKWCEPGLNVTDVTFETLSI